MHEPKEDEWFGKDITKVRAEDLPDVALWVGGFPCQDVSTAGNRKGLQGKRSSLFYEFVRLLRERGEHRPRWVILENVKGLFSSDRGWDFGKVLFELAALGYGVEYALLNSKDYGVPQSRERVFLIGDLTGRSTGKIFPIRGANEASLAKILGVSQNNRVYDTSGLAPTLTAGMGGGGGKTGLFAVARDDRQGLVIKEQHSTIDASYGHGLRTNQQRTGVLHSRLPRAVLKPDKEKIRQNGRRCKNENEEMFTLTASDIHGILMESRIRRLTPLETFRLQGVPDEYFYRAAAVCSDTQLYKQAGNAVTVPVIKAIGLKIKAYLEQEEKEKKVGDSTDQ